MEELSELFDESPKYLEACNVQNVPPDSKIVDESMYPAKLIRSRGMVVCSDIALVVYDQRRPVSYVLKLYADRYLIDFLKYALSNDMSLAEHVTVTIKGVCYLYKFLKVEINDIEALCKVLMILCNSRKGLTDYNKVTDESNDVKVESVKHFYSAEIFLRFSPNLERQTLTVGNFLRLILDDKHRIYDLKQSITCL